MVVFQNDITEEERELIVQLRELVKDELPHAILSMTQDDQGQFLVRWLRARDLNLGNATRMLQKSLQWRKEKDVDRVLNLKLDPFFQENFQFKYVGPDKHGHPVFAIPYGEWDFRKVLNNPDRLNEFDEFVTYYLELSCKYIREEHLKREENGYPPVTQAVYLFDVKNYPYGQLVNMGAMKKLLQFASVYEQHFPEIMFKGVFLNCPFYFNIFITLLKPVIATKTLAKLSCYPNIADWQRDMVEFLNPERIPERYGGTLKI